MRAEMRKENKLLLSANSVCLSGFTARRWARSILLPTIAMYGNSPCIVREREKEGRRGLSH